MFDMSNICDIICRDMSTRRPRPKARPKVRKKSAPESDLRERTTMDRDAAESATRDIADSDGLLPRWKTAARHLAMSGRKDCQVRRLMGMSPRDWKTMKKHPAFADYMTRFNRRIEDVMVEQQARRLALNDDAMDVYEHEFNRKPGSEWFNPDRQLQAARSILDTSSLNQQKRDEESNNAGQVNINISPERQKTILAAVDETEEEKKEEDSVNDDDSNTVNGDD